ncbi:MAG TPA: SRPBCC domain-containing protein [Acidimicrobiia bacterium]
MDEVFSAINDPNRRHLLDQLFECDGQTLGELCAHFPEMTRYGVMNHLRVLEAAGLVTTEKVGRSKFHYLNPVPIRLIQDRWISRFAEPRVGGITGIKALAETGDLAVQKPKHIYRVYINATAEEVWEAMTDPDKTSLYFYGTRVESDWEVGSAINYRYPDGSLASDGEILAIDVPTRLERTFRPLWDADLEAEGPAREVWALREVNGMVELSVEYYEIGQKSLDNFTQPLGLAYIVSGLKSLVETGRSLPSPG